MDTIETVIEIILVSSHAKAFESQTATTTYARRQREVVISSLASSTYN